MGFLGAVLCNSSGYPSQGHLQRLAKNNIRARLRYNHKRQFRIVMNNKALRIFSCPNIPSALALIISLLVCVSCTPEAVISHLGAQSDSIVKSANDKRQYQRIKLPNNLVIFKLTIFH